MICLQLPLVGQLPGWQSGGQAMMPQQFSQQPFAGAMGMPQQPTMGGSMGMPQQPAMGGMNMGMLQQPMGGPSMQRQQQPMGGMSMPMQQQAPAQQKGAPNSVGTPPLMIAKSPQEIAFQELFKQSVEIGREDLDEEKAIAEDQNLRQLVTHALHAGADDASVEVDELGGERVNGFYSPLADLD
tara:strand:- start:476 stop:1027 length:552 start_codon:yes stop_codon:yes gene_type:complete